MIRVILGVIVGYASWTALWLGGNALLFGEAAKIVGAGEPYTRPGPLAGVIAWSVVCSLVAGLVAAAVAKSRSRTAVPVMAALLLLTGIAVQAGVWALMPIWYHLAFLALIVPVSMMGARMTASH